MSRLIIISNRLPVTINKVEGEFIYHPSAGGLATGLNSLSDSWNKTWVGWPGQAIDSKKQQKAIQEKLSTKGLIPVFLSQKEIALYYEGFSNKTIWPHFHYFMQYTNYRDKYWEAYKAVNKKFAKVVLAHLKEDDLVWVHDYQLMLLPALIRKAFPSISIGFFLHIPFPSYEIFRVLPWREEILHGVLGADLIGFHTFGYMRHFLSAAYRIGGHEHHFGKMTVGQRVVNIDVFPMGIDYERFAKPSVKIRRDKDAAVRVRQLAKGKKVILSIDRLDYTKGIPQRIKAFARFLKRYPEYHGRVTFVLVVVPSRSNVDQYKELQHEVDTLVGHINGKYSNFDWVPVHYFYRPLHFSELITLYQIADIALITPLRDGMNLVAKEYIASKDTVKKGVLILSEMAGSVHELTDALIVNPHDINMITERIAQALTMSPKEQRMRLERMQEKLKKYDVRHWALTFIEEQKRLMKSHRYPHINRLTGPSKKQMFEAYHQAKKRLIILDYDGTLMPFHPDPQAVVPDKSLLNTLRQLKQESKNKLVINSGRDRHTLQEWLGPLDIDMAAEHGVWTKKNGAWNKDSGLAFGWKKEVKALLDNLVQRTPGSFIEEKDYSIVWHYRRIDRDLGEKRVREFRDVLLYLTANLDLQILEGNKVVEIKNAGVNKGKATQSWLAEADWDFILAIGDDHTDEDTFKALPPTAYTVKVGMLSTKARFNVVSVEEVRVLLGEFLKY
jgi:trehalose 6-phosphate synthase/phosphatase